MEAATAGGGRFEHLREHSIGLPQVLFQSITHMAPREYWVKRRAEFNPLLHLVLLVGGIVLFFFPLYYQYYKFVPTYPIKYANWVALAWIGLGIALTAWVVMTRPERLQDLERVYVEDETATPEERAEQFPTA